MGLGASLFSFKLSDLGGPLLRHFIDPRLRELVEFIDVHSFENDILEGTIPAIHHTHVLYIYT